LTDQNKAQRGVEFCKGHIGLLNHRYVS
jgi:hypothetical protein